MNKSFRSYAHVAIQFTAIFYFILSFNWIDNLVFQTLVLSGIILGLWSVWVMRHSVLTIFPDPNPAIRLIKKGPYRKIRHPMYSALFLVFIPSTIFQYSYLNLIILAIFTVNQVFKILFEEHLLMLKLPEYVDYQRETWRLVPWIF